MGKGRGQFSIDSAPKPGTTIDAGVLLNLGSDCMRASGLIAIHRERDGFLGTRGVSEVVGK